MSRKFLFLLLVVALAACEPLDSSIPPVVTRIPFYASETPVQFIIPVTDTPVILPPVTETPLVVQPLPATDPPIPATPVITAPAKWWEVYFTDPLNINKPEVIQGSIEEKLIQYINNSQISIHIA